MIDRVGTTQRTVTLDAGEMGLRWTAREMLEAEKQLRKVIGYLPLPQLAIAIEPRLQIHTPTRTQEAPLAVTM